jgi:anti-anti-sigma factor
VELAANDDETVLTLHGELDLWTQRALVNALAAVDDDAVRVVLDLSDLTFMDASGIGIIHRSRLLAEVNGNEVVLRSPSANILRILELTRPAPDAAVRPTALPLPSRTYGRAAL